MKTGDGGEDEEAVTVTEVQYNGMGRVLTDARRRSEVTPAV